MKEFLEKLSQTGIKVLDLVDKGIDKLPDGLQFAWNALVFRVQISGIAALVGSFVTVCICTFLLYKIIKKSKAYRDVMFDGFHLCVGGAILAVISIFSSVFILFNPVYWMMAIAPDKYILSEILLGFIK